MVKYIEKKRHHRKLFILLKIGNEKRISKIDMYPFYRTSGKEGIFMFVFWNEIIPVQEWVTKMFCLRCIKSVFYGWKYEDLNGIKKFRIFLIFSNVWIRFFGDFKWLQRFYNVRERTNCSLSPRTGKVPAQPGIGVSLSRPGTSNSFENRSRL